MSCFVLWWCLWSVTPFCVWILLMLLVYSRRQASHKQQINRLRLTMCPPYLIVGLRSCFCFLQKCSLRCPWMTPALSFHTWKISLFPPFTSSPHFIPSYWHFVYLPDYCQPSIFLTTSSSLVEKVPSGGNSLRWEFKAFESFDPQNL